MARSDLIIPFTVLGSVFPRHAILNIPSMLYDRRELNVNFVFNLSLFHGAWGRLIFERGWKFPSPLFAEEKGQREHWEEKRGGTFLVLTFASFQRNEPRGKWKSKTKGSARDNRLLLLSSFFRSWKRYPFPLFTLAGEYPCSLSSWG